MFGVNAKRLDWSMQGYHGLDNVDISAVDAAGNINRADTDAPVCAEGWHVCSGGDINRCDSGLWCSCPCHS